jgi:hypothetical protein
MEEGENKNTSHYQEEPGMKEFFASLHPEAQEELIRDGVIELVTAWAGAVPDPDRPYDRLALTISAEIADDFRPGIPWINAELDRLRAICGTAGEDISIAVQDALLVSLNTQRKEQDELRAGWIGGQSVAYLSNPQLMEIIGPAIRNATPDVMVWCHCWTVAMDDDGKMIVDCEPPLYYEGLDDESRTRIDERLRKVNAVIGRIVERLMAGEPV